MTLKHSLYSQDLDMPVAFFEVFNKENIKSEIISHLKRYPKDTLEHCKEYNKDDVKRFYGNQVINFYKTNRKGEVCKVIMKGNKEFLKSIE